MSVIETEKATDVIAEYFDLICDTDYAFDESEILRRLNAEAIDAVPVIRCKDCKYFDPPHVEKDGERYEYNEFPKEAFDLFGIGVTVKYGTNVGGRCTYYNMCGYPEDKSVYVPAKNYCGKAEPKEKQ